jgi:hypothetical protein
LRGQAIDSSWHTSNQNDIMPFSMPCYSYFSQLDTLKFRAKFGQQKRLTFPYRDFSEYAGGLADDTP